MNPKLVLELGTYTGYSAICMAMAMSDDSKLISIDSDETISHIPKEYIKKAGLENRIELIIGNGLNYLQEIKDESLDCIFIDADKSNYPNYVNLAHKKLKQNGFVLVDNVLWHGKILASNPDNRTKSILETNNLLADKNKWISVINPLRDGITIAMKK